jgi:hypothetical protein
MARRTTAALVGLCIGLSLEGCSSSQSGQSTSGPLAKQIGPEGGSVLLADGSGVVIPPGALSAGTSVTVALAQSAGALPSSDWIAAGPFYLLGPEGQAFSKPVTVTLAFDPSRLPEDVPADDISIVTSKATGTPDYDALPTTMVDSTHVSAQTTHFSIFLPVWERTQPCGDGRIPASAVCCDKASVTSSSYCTGKPGTNTSSGNATAECLANAAGTCTNSNPFASPRALYCCSMGGSQGSNDCPLGQYHCGLQCTSDRRGCQVGGPPIGAGGAPGNGTGGATGAGGTAAGTGGQGGSAGATFATGGNTSSVPPCQSNLDCPQDGITLSVCCTGQCRPDPSASLGLCGSGKCLLCKTDGDCPSGDVCFLNANDPSCFPDPCK